MVKQQLVLKDATGDVMTVLAPDRDDENTVLVTLVSNGFGAPGGTTLSFYLTDEKVAELASFLFVWMAARAVRLGKAVRGKVSGR